MRKVWTVLGWIALWLLLIVILRWALGDYPRELRAPSRQ